MVRHWGGRSHEHHGKVHKHVTPPPSETAEASGAEQTASLLPPFLGFRPHVAQRCARSATAAATASSACVRACACVSVRVGVRYIYIYIERECKYVCFSRARALSLPVQGLDLAGESGVRGVDIRLQRRQT